VHQNRLIYSYESYKALLRKRRKKIAVACLCLKSSAVTFSCPAPVTPFLPEGRGKYFSRLYKKSKTVKKNKHFSFATLTYQTSDVTNSQLCSHLKKDLDKFFKRLRNHNKIKEYFYVIELTKRGFVHIHVIFQGFVAKQAIFASWNPITNATCVRIRHIGYKDAIWYCIKYLTKSKKMSEKYWAIMFKSVDRLWSSSRNFFHMEEEEISDYLHLGTFTNSNHALTKFFNIAIANDYKTGLDKTMFDSLMRRAINNNNIVNLPDINIFYKVNADLHSFLSRLEESHQEIDWDTGELVISQNLETLGVDPARVFDDPVPF